jgi:prepilin-type N-terminal cleavage/methylation domain-containing protein
LVTPLFVNASGSDQPASRPGRHAGFTLIEILLVIALLGMGALLLVNSASDLLRTREARPDEIFWQAVTAARQLALESNQTVTLRYAKDKHALSWNAGSETAATLSFPGQLLEFLPVTAEQGTVLIGGQLTETGTIALVRFYPDGGCDAVRVQLTDAAGRRSVLAIDQWTCAPILAAAAP